MKPQFKPEEIYLDLSKLSEEQQERVMCVTGTTIEWIKYAGYLIYHKGWKTSNKSWLKDQNLTELTYSQFLDMMGESKEKSKVIENSEKELINNDGTLYIGEGLENYYKDQLERTGKFKVVSIDATSGEVLKVENNGWISVEKKLPSIEGEYLIHKKNDHTEVTYYDLKQWGYYYSGDEPPTHWMPLPEPPKF